MMYEKLKRLKKIILAYSDIKIMYRFVQSLIIILILFTIIVMATAKWSKYKLDLQKNLLFGKWNKIVVSTDDNIINYFAYHSFIEDYAIQIIQDNIKYDNKYRIIIGSADSKFLDIGNIEILSGRLPKYNDEVAIEEEYLSVLNIKNVGDIIPYNTKIKVLEGYKLCGIIENYSTRWNMVNWDVNYVNCFIKSAKTNSLNIFIKISSNIGQDIELNMLNYHDNIKSYDNSFWMELIQIWLTSIVLIIIFLLLIRRKLQKLLNFEYEYKKKKQKFNKRIIFIIMLLHIISIIILNSTVNNIMSQDYIINNKQNDFNINKKYNSRQIIQSHSDLFFIQYIKIEPNNYVLYYPNKFYIMITKILNLTLKLIFLNYLISNLLILLINYKLDNDKSIIMRNYFFGDNILKIIFKKKHLILLLFLNIFVITTVFLLSKLDLIYDLRIYRQLLIIIIAIILQDIVIYLIIRNLINRVEKNLLFFW